MRVYEMLGGTEAACPECGQILEVQVLHSAAGYYIGYRCDECGPVSRESKYYSTDDTTRAVLNSGFWCR